MKTGVAAGSTAEGSTGLGHGGLSIEGRGLAISFGGVHAVQDVTIGVRPGERRVLIGPNGAGKTTLFHLISGQRRPQHGRVLLGGRDGTRLPPYRRSQLGLARTFQITNLLAGLSVHENVLLATLSRSLARFSLWRPAGGYHEQERETERLLDEWGMAAVRDMPVGGLAYGEQRRLEIMLAIATHPRALLLDEPLAGLSPVEAERVARTIAALPRSLTLLLIDHDTDVALALADSVTVMSFGRILVEGSPDEVRADERVREIYLGTGAAGSPGTARGMGTASETETPDTQPTPVAFAAGEHGPAEPPAASSAGATSVPSKSDTSPGRAVEPAREPRLQVRDLHAYYGRSHVLQGVDLAVQDGEVLALLGRNGMGKTTLIHAIAGLLRPAAGMVRVHGRTVSGLAPERIAAAGVALVPQGRRLFASLTVSENLEVAYHPVAPSGWTPQRIFTAIPRLGERRRQTAATLSGGEQQLAAMARALLRNGDVLLLDEPSEGLAPAMLSVLADLVRATRQRGAAVLLVEQKLGFALEVADRAAVMVKGRIVYECSHEGLRVDNEVLRRHLGL